ncbi:hypothetical protein LCGC14_3056020, partial [marine sediment metagenome]
DVYTNNDGTLGNTTLEIEEVCWANVTNGEWITPSYVIDIDDEDVETDLNTYVDIAGDKMTGILNVSGAFSQFISPDGDGKVAVYIDGDGEAGDFPLVIRAGTTPSVLDFSDRVCTVNYQGDVNCSVFYGTGFYDDGVLLVDTDTTIGNCTVSGSCSSIVCNSSIAILPPPFEQEVISYYDATNKTLKVGSCQGNVNGCNRREFSPSVVSTIDDAGDVGQYSSIAIGDDGFPVISYYDEGNGSLKVAKCFSEYCTGGNEKINFADTSVGVGQFTSIALGANGNPVIAYYDFANGNLKVSICGDTDCNSSTERTLESGGDVGKYASIAVCTAAGCLDNNPVISYADSTLTRAMVYK